MHGEDNAARSIDPEVRKFVEQKLDKKPVKRKLHHKNRHLNRAATQATPGTMTKGMVMEALNLNERRFDKMLEEKLLEPCDKHPTRGWHLFSERDVTKLKHILIMQQGVPHKESADLQLHDYSLQAAKTVFKALQEGASIVGMIDQLNIHPLAMRAIVRDYAALSESILLSKQQMDIINALPLEGEFPIMNPNALVSLLHDLSVEKKCPKCKTRDRTHLCGPCYVDAKQETERAEKAKQAAQLAAANTITLPTDDESDETSFDLTSEE